MGELRGQRIWDKGRSYWEHIGEHIGNMFGGWGARGEGEAIGIQ